MIVFLKIVFITVLIVVLILFVLRLSIAKPKGSLPDNYQELLDGYVKIYRALDEEAKQRFEKRAEQFLASVKITGVNAEVEDLDRVLIAAGAVIPVFAIPDWQYINLHEVLLYPGTFNEDFDLAGTERNYTGMVGTGPMQYLMILTKWQLRQGFINEKDTHNTAIHEFAHLVDKMDGSLDGVPEIILERKHTERWKSLMHDSIVSIKAGRSDIHPYAATNTAEFFAVISEYFFEQPQQLKNHHPDLYGLLCLIYKVRN